MMKSICMTAVMCVSVSLPVYAGSPKPEHNEAHSAKACANFGPQTPRDIDSVKGTNSVSFSVAPKAAEMQLCNIHFHENAEHKAKDFSLYAGDGHNGYGSGYQCNMGQSLTKAEMAPTSHKVCAGKHGDLQPGDTIEVHWVHSSCDVAPGPTLNACFSEACANPVLRVETQVFTLVNDGSALDFNELQAAQSLPKNTGKPVEFLGSTTGPSYSEAVCSPYQVTWSVRPQCAKLDINSVAKWCESNVFNEDHAHGVRKLVTNPALLSKIKK
jgi:carbonic anhydrase